MREALAHVGISIIGAMITTTGSACFLLFCYLYLFFQLGVMMVTNTLIAVFFSFFFLATTLMICGPVGNCSKLASILICRCCWAKRKAHTAVVPSSTYKEIAEDMDDDSLVNKLESEAALDHRRQMIDLQQKREEAHQRIRRRLLAHQKYGRESGNI